MFVRPPSVDERTRPVHLESENVELRMERDVLKRSAAVGSALPSHGHKWRSLRRHATIAGGRLDHVVNTSCDVSGGVPGTYGSPQVFEDLIEDGWKVSITPSPRRWPVNAYRAGPET